MQEVQETRVWSLVGKILWSRKWQPIPVLLPGKFHRRRSLVGYSPWCCQKLDMTEHMPQLIFVYMGVLIFSSVQLYYMFCSFIYHHSEERRRQWHPTPVLLPGKSHGRRSLVGCSPWGCEESDTTEWLHFHALEKEMATHSSVLAWRIPGTGEPGWAAVRGVAQSRTRLKRLSSNLAATVKRRTFSPSQNILHLPFVITSISFLSLSLLSKKWKC